MALIKILIDTGSESYSELDNLQDRKESLPKVINYLKAINSGAESATVTVQKEAVQATSTLTVSGSGVVADETFSVNGETFTFKDLSGAGYTGLWVDINAQTATQTGDNIVSAIENQTLNKKLEGVLGASNAAGVVTITSDEGGKIGNAIYVSESATDVAAAEGVTGINGTVSSLTTG